MKITGSCHCGNIAYEADLDTEKVGICHCTDCQRLSGTAFRTVAMVDAQSFKIQKGKLKTYIKTGDSGNRRAQTFCSDCGAHIYATSADEEPRVLNLRVGTINQSAELAPKFQLWGRSALPWIDEIANIPIQDKQ